MNNFYTYIFLDTRKPGSFNYGNFNFDYEPFYVGKGKGPRYLKHLQAASNPKSDNFVIRKIRKIQNETGTDPLIIKVLDNVSEDLAINKEIELIGLIGRLDKENGPLVNFTDGGEGMSGYVMTKEHRSKISESNRNRVVTEYTKNKISNTKQNKSKEEKEKIGKKISETKRKNWSMLSDEEKKKKNGHNKGKNLSSDQKEKISKALKGKPKSDEWKRKMSQIMKGKKNALKNK